MNLLSVSEATDVVTTDFPSDVGDPVPGGPASVPPASRDRLGRATSTAAATADFDAFYRHEYPAVVALAYVLSGRGGIAEDITQDAFLVAHQRWVKVGGYDQPGAFVRRVVANMAVSQRRRLAAEGRAKARLALRATPVADDIDAPDPGFWRAVRALPRRQAQVLALYYLEDRSADEIGAILGCSAPTVRVHLHRGRLALEQLLHEGSRP